MVIAPEAANTFIREYSRLLQHVFIMKGGESGGALLTMLAAGRAAIFSDPLLLERAVEELATAKKSLAPSVLDAVKTLKLSRWVYLRDTTRYSVFLDADGDNAYPVKGLTHPVRDILGVSGVTFVTALVQYGDHIVCDGIVSGQAWLGQNIKKDYANRLAEAKKGGRFHAAVMP